MTFAEIYKQFLIIPQFPVPGLDLQLEITEYLLTCKCGAQVRINANFLDQLRRVVCRNCGDSRFTSVASHSGQPFCAVQVPGPSFWQRHP